MIRSTNTIDIDGTVLTQEELANAINFNSDDRFNRWVVRPIAALTAIGLGAMMIFASAFFVLLSLAMLPLLAIAFWVVRAKIERDLKNADPVVDTQSNASEKPEESVQAAS